MWMKQKDEPIRVAQIMGKLWAGGVEMVVFNYYRAIDKSKIQFDFYYDADSTVEPPQNLIDMGARFYKIPPYQKLPQYIRELKKHLKENQYLIVHSHLNTLSVFPLSGARRSVWHDCFYHQNDAGCTCYYGSCSVDDDCFLCNFF